MFDFSDVNNYLLFFALLGYFFFAFKINSFLKKIENKKRVGLTRVEIIFGSLFWPLIYIFISHILFYKEYKKYG